jgi:hypothetical protein
MSDLANDRRRYRVDQFIGRGDSDVSVWDKERGVPAMKVRNRGSKSGLLRLLRCEAESCC